MSNIRTFNAALYQDKNFYIAFCDDLETVDQGATPEQAINNLQISTQSYLQQVVFPNITLNFDTRSEAANLIVLPLPQVSSCRLIAVLERQGFRRTKHCIVLEKKTHFGNTVCVVPLHHQLAAGTISRLLYYAGITPQEFIDSL